jgi:hypothetical protein
VPRLIWAGHGVSRAGAPTSFFGRSGRVLRLFFLHERNQRVAAFCSPGSGGARALATVTRHEVPGSLAAHLEHTVETLGRCHRSGSEPSAVGIWPGPGRAHVGGGSVGPHEPNLSVFIAKSARQATCSRKGSIGPLENQSLGRRTSCPLWGGAAASWAWSRSLTASTSASRSAAWSSTTCASRPRPCTLSRVSGLGDGPPGSAAPDTQDGVGGIKLEIGRSPGLSRSRSPGFTGG